MSTEAIKNHRHFWEQHVTQFIDSGLSKAQYCREHELTYHQFVYWVPPFSPLINEPATAINTRRFLPVRLNQSPQPS